MKRLDKMKWSETRDETPRGLGSRPRRDPRRTGPRPRRDRDETLVRLETFSRPRRRDQDYIPEKTRTMLSKFFFGVSTNPSVLCRCMVTDSNTNEKTERHSAQMTDVGHFLEGQSNKRKGQSQNWTTQYGWHVWKKTPLPWTVGYVLRMDHQRIHRQTLHWEVPEFKRGEGRPRTNWRSTVNKDLLRMWIPWEEAKVAAQTDQNIIHLNADWIKVKVKVKNFERTANWSNVGSFVCD